MQCHWFSGFILFLRFKVNKSTVSFHEGFPLRWKDQGFQAGACVIFPNGAQCYCCLVLVVAVRLGHHDGWMIAILLCPTFPSDDIHSHVSSAFSCTSSIFSASSQLPVFGTQLAGDLGWKDVGKYHSCIQKRRKSWSNKSFESLLLHVSMAATLLAIFQRIIPYSIVHVFVI